VLGHRITFRHPRGDPTPRTALLLPGFKRHANVRSFTPTAENTKWLDKLGRFEPHCLAGSLSQLLFLASLRKAESQKLGSLQHSLVVIFQTEQPWLNEEAREELWSAFGLPIYEQIYSASGLLATECEVHDGLHVCKGSTWMAAELSELWYSEPASWWEDGGDSFVPTGLFGSVDLSPCACGRSTPRLQICANPILAFSEVA
jgi:hypothetical protein